MTTCNKLCVLNTSFLPHRAWQNFADYVVHKVVLDKLQLEESLEISMLEFHFRRISESEIEFETEEDLTFFCLRWA